MGEVCASPDTAHLLAFSLRFLKKNWLISVVRHLIAIGIYKRRALHLMSMNLTRRSKKSHVCNDLIQSFGI